MVDHPAQRVKRELWWLCRCECGTERLVRPYRLRNGESRSCGCLQREIAAENAGMLTHGRSNTPEYRAWQQAKQRCFNTKHPLWADYGGRGITMTEAWISDFETFFEHIGSRPGSGYSLGRIDNDGHYEPGNVEWQTPVQQNRNKRNTTDKMRARANQEVPRTRPGEWFWRGKWRPL